MDEVDEVMIAWQRWAFLAQVATARRMRLLCGAPGTLRELIPTARRVLPDSWA
jgi:hypothetical protein